MYESHANRVQDTAGASSKAVELTGDELEQVVGGLHRTWSEPSTGSDDERTLEPSEESAPAGTSLVR